MAKQRKGNIDEEGTAASFLQRDPENKESNNEISKRAHRNAQHAFIAHNVIGSRILGRARQA